MMTHANIPITNNKCLHLNQNSGYRNQTHKRKKKDNKINTVLQFPSGINKSHFIWIVNKNKFLFFYWLWKGRKSLKIPNDTYIRIQKSMSLLYKVEINSGFYWKRIHENRSRVFSAQRSVKKMLHKAKRSFAIKSIQHFSAGKDKKYNNKYKKRKLKNMKNNSFERIR